MYPKILFLLATFSLVLSGVATPVFELAKEGTVRAAIVLPAKPNGVETFAAEELKYHLDKMFAADFKVVGEADLGNADGVSRIFLGATKAFHELARYRKSVESDFICAFDKEAKNEARMGWPHDKLDKEYEVW